MKPSETVLGAPRPPGGTDLWAHLFLWVDHFLCHVPLGRTQFLPDLFLRPITNPEGDSFYLVATKHQGITYGGNLRVPLGVSEMPVNFEAGGGLHVYTDSSWGNSAKPFGGYIIMLHNGPVDWSSKKLRIVADSTCEAETATWSRDWRRELSSPSCSSVNCLTRWAFLLGALRCSW